MCLAAILLIAFWQSIPGLPQSDNITVVDGNKPCKPYVFTDFAGIEPWLNAHLFPAINAYNVGKYNAARIDFTFVLKRIAALNGDPRQAVYVGALHYLRGMIYLYHAKGIGRHQAAKDDFEAAIKWQPNNYLAYLELSRVYSDLGFVPPATAILQQLLDLKPDEAIAKEAQNELR